MVITFEILINYVTEIHIWVKPDSCLGTKSVVKGLYLALWNAYANQGPCLYDLGQKQNINIAQVEWEYLVHVHLLLVRGDQGCIRKTHLSHPA